MKKNDELNELKELEQEIKQKIKSGATELTDEELDEITAGSMSPYEKRKALSEIKKRLF